MILLDPDLGPDLDAVAAPRATRAALPSLRMPSVRILARFLSKARDAVRLRGQVTVLLTSDLAIRRLNRQFRGKNKATDVLSFPADTSVQNQEKGDLAISVPTARRQAAEQGHTLATEIKVLILHGLLHLAGYDHETDQGQMARRERLLRSRLGLPEGLIERSGKEGSLRSQVRRRNKDAPNPSTSSGQALGHPVRKVRERMRRTKP